MGLRDRRRVALVVPALAAAMLAAPAARAGTGRWTSYGPPEGTVNAIALDPANQATVYAGTSYARVFKSTNRGSSWRVRDQGLPVNTFVNALAVDPAHTNSVYAGTNAGLFNVTASEPALASASTRHMSRPSRHSDPASWMGGTQIWRRYVGVPDTLTGSNAIATSPDGSKVFVTGWSIVDNDAYATFALDLSSGRRLWTAMYRGPSGGGDEARAIGVSPDGSRVFVTGESVGQSGTNDDYATIAYDASTGARLWVARYNYGPAYNFDFANSLTVSPDGARVFVTGGSCREPSYECNFDYATAAYDASTGGQLWVRRYNGPGNEDDIAWSLAASPDGSKVFVTGYSTGTTSSLDYATIAYDGGTGSIVWLRRYNGPANGNDFARALGVSPDGSAIYVTGSSEDLAGNENSDDFATLAYSEARGRRLWTQRFNGPANLRDDADSIAVTGSRVFVTGMSNSYTTGDFVYAALAYDARSGVLSWATWSAGPAHTYSDVTVSPDGAEVFMTGTTTGALTVAYDSTTGSQLWKRIYNGLGDEGDYVTSIATSPDSSAVFVAGDAEYVKGTSDWAGFVLAYSALSMANEKSPLVAR